MTLKEKILKICDELEGLDNSNFSWQYVRELYNKGKEKIAAAKSAGITEELEEAEANIILTVANEVLYKFVETVNEGEAIPPNIWPANDDLNFFQEIADELPKTVDWLEKEKASEIKDPDLIPKMRRGNEQLKNFIQEERKKLDSSSTWKKKVTYIPNPQDQQKIQNQQKEIELLKKQLAELQNQIEELKKNQNSSTDDQITSQIKSLQNKKQEIQSKLKQKQSQQKELQDKVNSSQSNKSNEFNWLYVVIPGAVLLVVMGVIIAYLVGKRSKKA